MRKFTFIFLLSFIAQLGFVTTQAQSVTIPEPDKIYTIKHSAGMFLTRSLGSSAPVIKMASGDFDQQFMFIPVSGEGAETIYNILCVGFDEYLAKLDAGNKWTMSWVVDPNSPSSWPSSELPEEDRAKNAQFQIVAKSDEKGDYVVFKNIANNAYVGVDATTDNSTTYVDKSETNSKWYIAEATGEVDKSALENLYNEALDVYENTTAGDGSDQYPESNRTALKNALEAAEFVLSDPGAFVEDVNDALLDLTDVLSEYRASVAPFQPNASAVFYIKHSSGFYFSSSRTISSATYGVDQHFQFVPVGNNYYNIQSVETGEFLTRAENGYGILWGSESGTNLAHFIIKSIGTGGYYTIRCIGLSGDKSEANSHLGTDQNANGAGVYIDKNGRDGKHYWVIQDITAMPIVKDGLEEAIDRVADFLEYAVKGDGSDQYPAVEYDALTAAKTAAEAVFANASATQGEVGDATVTLNRALEACIAAVNPMNPDVTLAYSVVHYGGMFLNAIEFDGYEESEEEGTIIAKPNGLNLAEEADIDNQKISFATTDVDNAYNIMFASVPGKYLTRCTDPHATEAENFDDYKLIWGDNPDSPYAKFEIKRIGNKDYYTIKCITEGPKRTLSFMGSDSEAAGSGVVIDKNGTQTNHFWRIGEYGTLSNVSAPVSKKDAVGLYTVDGKLVVDKLSGNNRVMIYNTLGQVVHSEITSNSMVEKQLPQGIYIINISGDKKFSGKVVVR